MSASTAVRQAREGTPTRRLQAEPLLEPGDARERQAAPAPMPPLLAACYMLASVLLALTQGLGMNLITANLPQIQGALGATTNEATWLSAAYMAPNVSLALALIKIRTQYGLRNFAELSIAAFVLVSLMHLFVDDLQSALVVRFFSGIAAAPISTLGFLYMLEAFPPAKKMNIGPIERRSDVARQHLENVGFLNPHACRISRPKLSAHRPRTRTGPLPIRADPAARTSTWLCFPTSPPPHLCPAPRSTTPTSRSPRSKF